MTPYQVAKLVSWAGTLRTRKRLQKVVYLLQSAGCEAMDADFILHHYGPYSAEVATLADQMSAAGLLEESAEPNAAGMAYSYSLTEKAKALMVGLEADARGQAMLAKLSPFEALARRLVGSDLSLLGHGSTVVYFFRHTHDWDQALAGACSFKRLEKGSGTACSALDFAKTVMQDPAPRAVGARG